MGSYIAGVCESEWYRLKKLSKRALTAQDIPNMEWKREYVHYQLREDGAIVRNGMMIELGWLDGHGGINFLK